LANPLSKTLSKGKFRRGFLKTPILKELKFPGNLKPNNPPSKIKFLSLLLA